MGTKKANNLRTKITLPPVFSHIVSFVRHLIRFPKQDITSNSDLLANNHDLDNFYVAFENKFRGTEEEIKKRQKVYIPRLRRLGIDFARYPVLDIGCGRGEMLQLLKEAEMRAIGLDLNKSMVERCRRQGLDAIQTDALDYLATQKSDSLGAITGFHIVEHIPFNILLKIFEECRRVVVPGGVVIFETPNPENVTVGASSFYNDPSHLRPLPPELLRFLFQYFGFMKVKTLYFRPVRDLPTGGNTTTNSMARHLFGPTDYAVVGQKP